MMAKNKGYTLVGLLMVMNFIAIGSFTASARASKVVGEKKRADVSVMVLETALVRYRSEYNEWPAEPISKEKTRTFAGRDNAEVFGPLREKNNYDNIRFIDETAFFTTKNGKVVPLSETTGNQPLVFVPSRGKGFGYYTVVIDYENDMVTVSAPGYTNKRDD